MKTYAVTLAKQAGFHNPSKFKIISVEYFDDRDEAMERYRTWPSPSRSITYKVTLSEITPKSILDKRLVKATAFRREKTPQLVE